MERKEIKFEKIITEKDLERGNLILLTGRPVVGKTKTCSLILKKYGDKYGYLFFDLTGQEKSYWMNDAKRIIDYHTSVDIIKTIQNEKHNVKFVFIDYWQLVDDKEDWFCNMLLEMCWNRKLVIIVTSQLPRCVEKRQEHLPLYKDLEHIKMFRYARKVITIDRPAMYRLNVKDELKFVVCKDLDTYQN